MNKKIALIFGVTGQDGYYLSKFLLSKNYEVHIGTNLIPKLKNILKKNKLLFSKCLIVIDNKIPKKFRTLLLKNLKNQKIYTLNFNANEKNKSYLSIDKIHNVLFKNNFYREDCIISFGGGITGDVVGYAASTYKSCLLYTSPSPRDLSTSRMPSSA